MIFIFNIKLKRSVILTSITVNDTPNTCLLIVWGFFCNFLREMFLLEEQCFSDGRCFALVCHSTLGTVKSYKPDPLLASAITVLPVVCLASFLIVSLVHAERNTLFRVKFIWL